MQAVMRARERTNGQCQTKYGWDDAGDGDDKNRVQMTNGGRDDVNDSQALTGSDITRYRALVARNQFLVPRPIRSYVCVNASLLYDGKPASV